MANLERISYECERILEGVLFRMDLRPKSIFTGEEYPVRSELKGNACELVMSFPFNRSATEGRQTPERDGELIQRLTGKLIPLFDRCGIQYSLSEEPFQVDEYKDELKYPPYAPSTENFYAQDYRYQRTYGRTSGTSKVVRLKVNEALPEKLKLLAAIRHAQSVSEKVEELACRLQGEKPEVRDAMLSGMEVRLKYFDVFAKHLAMCADDKEKVVSSPADPAVTVIDASITPQDREFAQQRGLVN